MCPTSIRGRIRVNDFFSFRGGELYAEDTPITQIAAAVETPCYVYSAAAFVEQYRRFAAAFAAERPLVCYAVKANSNLAVLRLFAALGAGADVVSEGELRRALAADMPPERIVFSGVGKTAPELAAALSAGIYQINVESIAELRLLSALAERLGRMAPVALRVNPDVDALTHAKIATGKKENKFGIDFDEAAAAYRLAQSLPGIEPVGFALHIGSQLVSLDPYRRAFAKVAELVRAVRSAGLAVDRVDLGGGLGVRYRDERPPQIEDYARLSRQIFAGLDVSLAFEPGRVLTAAAGILVAQVLYLKETKTRRFVIVDAAMNDLIRPSLYGAWHDIIAVVQPPPGAASFPADVVGPVCESGDTFAVNRDLPPLSAGDLIAFTEVGAYGAVMSSTYNSRLLVPEVMVAGDRFAVIRPRPSYDALLSLDRVPAWLDDCAIDPPSNRGAA